MSDHYGNLVSLARARAAERDGPPAFTFLNMDGAAVAQFGYATLDLRARALAVALAEHCRPGDRALIALPSGLDYITALFGCFYAGVIAVPAFSPAPRTFARLRAIIDNACPRILLSSRALSARSGALLEASLRERPVATIHVDEVDPLQADAWTAPDVGPRSIAILQYTSGSTAEPKGAVLTHENLLSNQAMIAASFAQDRSARLASWLPFHHDMGLSANIMLPLYLGAPCVLMSPIDVLQRPLLWLRAISQWRATTGGGPNFIYDLCVQRSTPEQRSGLDLSSWEVAFIGAEPVRAETMDRFAAAFAPAGFRADAFLPGYGLAEATIFVTGRPKRAGRAQISADPQVLEREGRAVPAAGGRPIVCCGPAWNGGEVRIVNPDTAAECRAWQVGEIWVAGANVASGYWNNDEATRNTFGAKIAGGERDYLRTGDLGFLAGGELYITGRLKDVIKVRGRSCHPEDIERSVENGCPEIRANSCAAFSIDTGGDEKIVVVAELERSFDGMLTNIAAKIRRTVSSDLELATEGIVLIKAGRLPKTSSGKIQRRLCRTMLLQRQFEPLIESWISFSFRGRGDGHAEAPPPAQAV